MTSQTSLSFAALCHPSALSSKTSLKITGCPGRLLTKCLHWRWRHIGAAFQRNRLSQHCTDTIDARLSFCGISPLQLAASRCALLPATSGSDAQGWTERADTDIDINDIQPLAVAGSIHTKLQSERCPGPAPFQLPDPLQPACSLTDLLTAVATLVAKRQPHSAPLLHSAWTVQQVITEECRILELFHYKLGTPTPAAWIVLETRHSLWCQQCQQCFPQSPRSLIARVPSGVLASGAQGIANVYVPNRPFSLESGPSCIGSSAWFLSCAFWICLQIAGALLG